MKIKQSLIDEIVVLSLEGELTIDTREMLRERISSVTSARGGSWLILDMTGLTYIDSSGLGLLVEVQEELKSEGGKLALAKLKDNIRRVIEVTKLTKLLSIYSTVEDAKEALKK